jgi:hypothetical protein
MKKIVNYKSKAIYAKESVTTVNLFAVYAIISVNYDK